MERIPLHTFASVDNHLRKFGDSFGVNQTP